MNYFVQYTTESQRPSPDVPPSRPVEIPQEDEPVEVPGVTPEEVPFEVPEEVPYEVPDEIPISPPEEF